MIRVAVNVLAMRLKHNKELAPPLPPPPVPRRMPLPAGAGPPLKLGNGSSGQRGNPSTWEPESTPSFGFSASGWLVDDRTPAQATGVGGTNPGAPVQAWSDDVDPAAESHGAHPGGLSGMDWTDAGQKVPRGKLGLRVMRHVLRVTLSHFGPAGQAILEEELRRFAATPSTLSTRQFTDFLYAVADRLSDRGASAHGAFLAEVLGDRR